MMRSKIGVIPFYIFFLLSCLFALIAGYNLFLPLTVTVLKAYLDVFATLFSWEWSESVAERLAGLQPGLLGPYEILVSCVIACLAVCVLLYLWLKARPVAIVLTLVLSIAWIVLVVGYARGGAMPAGVLDTLCLLCPISPEIITILLIIAVLGLPVLRLFDPFLAKAAIFFLALPWLLLVLAGRYQAGVAVLLAAAATYAVFGRGLLIISGYLLPTGDGRVRHKIPSFLRDFTLGCNRPAWVVVSELYEEDRLEVRIRGSPYSGGFNESEDERVSAIGPGIVICDCDHAVAITSGPKFKGVKGPGVVFTGYAEQPTQIIDLRPQLRTFPVEALTKDGVRVKTVVFISCKIDSRDRQPTLGEPLPYNRGAAFKALQAQPVEHEDEEVNRVTWDRIPRRLAIPILQDVISEYTLDALYAPYRLTGFPPRAEIADRFIGRLSGELKLLGMQLAGGGISDLEPVDSEVYLKRARTWQEEWKREIALRQVEGQAAWLHMVERAQAEAQADLILDLGRRLEELSVASTGFRPKQALDLLAGFLDELMKQQPTLREVVPGETLQALAEIRRAIG